MLVAIGGIAVEGQLPQVEHNEAENHDTGNHHGTGRKGSLQRTFLLVVSAGIVVLILEHQSEHNVYQSHGQQAQTNGPKQPGGHGVQPRCVVVNPGAVTRSHTTTENGHIAGQVPHQEEEETRSRKSHKNLAADRGRDEFACCRDNIVHKCNNVFAPFTLL